MHCQRTFEGNVTSLIPIPASAFQIVEQPNKDRNKPPQGKRVMHLTIQAEDDSRVCAIFHGCTWFFRDQWDDCGAEPFSYEQEGQTQYCRVIKTIDITDKEGEQKIFRILDTVLKNLMCCVHIDIDREKVSRTNFRAFLLALRGREELFFV